MRRLVLATTNKGKLRELRAALQDTGLELIPLAAFPELPEAVEDGKSFAENARKKALHYYELCGLPCLADDSGLCVAALDDQPGVRSARLAETNAARIEKLLELLRGEQDRRARFECALCCALNPERLIEVRGTVSGMITESPQGTEGFGYDPVFYYPPLKQTFGEISNEVKNSISHRAMALARLKQRIQTIMD